MRGLKEISAAATGYHNIVKSIAAGARAMKGKRRGGRRQARCMISIFTGRRILPAQRRSSSPRTQSCLPRPDAHSDIEAAARRTERSCRSFP